MLFGLLIVTATPARAGAHSGGALAMHSMLQINSPRPFKEAMFAAAAAAGASEIRVDASLGALNNPWIGSAMWNGLDDYMQLSQQYDLPVLLDFNASNDPSLESCPTGVDPSRALCGVTDLQGYYNEIAAVVSHTRGVIDDFEVVNEPDGAWAFSGTPAQYAGMLTTAYAAVHDNDPSGRVVLGGIMSPNDAAWLATVFTTPGFNAAHAFDIANVHVRDTVANVASQLLAWRKFFTFFGDGALPLWVTETGYPADPAYQYDSNFRGTDAASGAAEQAAYLAQELPALVYVGATRIFVTERDSGNGQYASEGLLGGLVADNNQTDPAPAPRPAYSVFTQLAAQLVPAAPAPIVVPPPVATTPAPAAPPPVATTPAPAAPTPAHAVAAPQPSISPTTPPPAAPTTHTAPGASATPARATPKPKPKPKRRSRRVTAASRRPAKHPSRAPRG